jgi:hypothetical protein
LEPSLRDALGAAEISRLAGAVAASLHDVYLIAVMTAALTLIVALGFPARLSPLRPAPPGSR